MSLDNLPLIPGAWFAADPNHGQKSRQAVEMAADAGMKVYMMDFVRETDVVPRGGALQTSTDWVGAAGELSMLEGWADAIISEREATVIVTDGVNGIIAGSRSVPLRRYPVFRAEKVVDTTGAGDSFRAGMLFGLSQNWSLGDCLRFASAA
jgi:sugar/nucleoside kinase (ribokinase family)